MLFLGRKESSDLPDGMDAIVGIDVMLGEIDNKIPALFSRSVIYVGCRI